MLNNVLKAVFGSRNERLLKTYRKTVVKINALEPETQALTDEALKAKTPEFKERLANGETLDNILPEAFAVVREASIRTLGMRHFDVQMIGGIVLHDGKIAEMRTGEGKTLTSTLAAYLNALAGNGVHIVTVNDYLASRDAEWMRPVYEFLGLTVGVNLASMEHDAKQAAYAADVTLGTNNEFGFDYLRDNMVFELDQRVQRPLFYAIADEVDSILIDEARTPLIISGQAEESSDLYNKVNKLIPGLTLQKMTEEQKEEDVLEEDRGDYTVDEKQRTAHLTEQGHQHTEELLIKQGLLNEGESLYDLANISMMHYLLASLRAHVLYQRDVHYVVKNDEIHIVDEHTGRLMEGRRWSDGLHQAVEAKEGVTVQLENQTLASITFQNFFRLYKKLSGMTGTADTEAFELQSIYGLEVVVVPTNKPMIRDDRSDMMYLTQKEKFNAIIAEIKTCQETTQPVLVGTASIEASEHLSSLLKGEKIKHEVLNAKQHEREANIIAQAGRPGAITIATNMAGRGTDIVLGGNPEVEIAESTDLDEAQIDKIRADARLVQEQVIKSGGLHVLGTERHESRRIDNQLRGRSGRQGDPGSSQFYLSMEDNLLRIFAGERMSNMMRKLGIKEGDVIQHSMINRTIEKAQRRVEGYNFDVRKNLLEYDDVANDQRKVMYQQRFELLSSDDISSSASGIRDDAIDAVVTQYIPPQTIEDQWDIVGLENELSQEFAIKLSIAQWLKDDDMLHEETIRERIVGAVATHMKDKEDKCGSEVMRQVERSLMLQMLDQHWKDHLATMDHLRQSIHLRSYAQKNPTQEFKREAFGLFTKLLDNLKYEYSATLCRVDLISQEQLEQQQRYQQFTPQLNYQHAEANAMTSAEEAQPEMPDEMVTEQEEAAEQAPFIREEPKVGRNDPCPCGSGKKYKQCHGKIN
ncbi:MAG: preprotein translocase subunit SecA [Coxiella sp. (in: Bacteria)]|nr:MAG: preprotein translocase subunit SecA [Coxiella sp. (in: g-proteobacteria)]